MYTPAGFRGFDVCLCTFALSWRSYIIIIHYMRIAKMNRLLEMIVPGKPYNIVWAREMFSLPRSCIIDTCVCVYHANL